jgi:hypothetical protein
MSTKDQLLYSALHGTAMRYAAERRDLAESIAELRQIADGHVEVLAEAAGIAAGWWYAWPSTHVVMAGGHEVPQGRAVSGRPQGSVGASPRGDPRDRDTRRLTR